MSGGQEDPIAPLASAPLLKCDDLQAGPIRSHVVGVGGVKVATYRKAEAGLTVVIEDGAADNFIAAVAIDVGHTRTIVRAGEEIIMSPQRLSAPRAQIIKREGRHVAPHAITGGVGGLQ